MRYLFPEAQVTIRAELIRCQLPAASCRLVESGRRNA
jgi:hypothetical protein